MTFRAALALIGLAAALIPGPTSGTDILTPPYNVVIIKTDDQRWDTVDRRIASRIVMPRTTARLVQSPNAVVFRNAITPTPSCCPERAALLSGGYYPHHTGVVQNFWPNGGAGAFRLIEERSLAVDLQRAGYRTGLFGKYLNDLPQERLRTPGYTPAGWTRFVGSLQAGDWYNFSVLVDGVHRRFSCAEPTCPARDSTCVYANDYYRDEMLAFLREHAPAAPVFAVFTPHAVHGPTVPACRHRRMFVEWEYRERAWCERSVSDKPRAVRPWMAACRPERVVVVDEGRRKQLRTLQAVDEAVEKIVDTMNEYARYPTVFVYTSDQGFLWGEHRMWGKGKPYEEALKVPLIVVVPGLRGHKVDTLVSPGLDLGPTIRALAGLPGDWRADGINLVPLLQGASGVRRRIVIQYYGEEGIGPWAGVRFWERTPAGVREYKYVEYGTTGENELYLLTDDPYEDRNVVGDARHAEAVASLAEFLAANRGFQILTPGEPPPAFVDEAYVWELRAWGGKAPYVWSARGLPPGLTLTADGANGARVTGTPIMGGRHVVEIIARDSTPVRLTRRPQQFVMKAIISVGVE